MAAGTDWGRHKIDFSTLPPTWIDQQAAKAYLDMSRYVKFVLMPAPK